MNRLLRIVLILLTTAMPSLAQNTIDGFAGKVYKAGNGESMPYRLFVPPNYDPAKKYPLILWLHGSGGAGTDNRKQISLSSTLGTHVWTRPENQMKYPAFVLAPQCPTRKTWNTPGQLALVLEILASVQKEFNIDADRLYVAGQSMGGYGTWEIIAERPKLFAAAAPMCGGGSVSNAPLMANIPIWAFHGAADPTVPVFLSRNMIEAIRKAGGNPRYTEYPGVGHEVWEKAFKEPGFIDWVFAQHR